MPIDAKFARAIPKLPSLRLLTAILLLALCGTLPGCTVVSAAGSVVGAGVSAVSTAASVTGSVVSGTVKAVTP